MKKRVRILWIGGAIIFQTSAIFAMSSNQIGEFHMGYRLVESNGYGTGGSGYLTSLNSVFTNYQLKDNYTIFVQANFNKGYGAYYIPVNPANYGIIYGIDKTFSKSSSSISVQNSKLSNGISSQNMNIFSFNDNRVYRNIIHKGKFEEKVLSSGETASYFSVVNTLPINSKWSIDYIDTLQIASKLYTQSIQPYLVADNYLNYLFNTQNYENVSLGMSYNDENNSGIFADSKIGYALFGSNQLGGGENYFTTLYIDSKVGVNLNIMTNWSVKLYAEPMVVQNIIGINLVPNYSMIVGLNMGYHY